MAAGMISISHGGSGRSASYILRSHECLLFESNIADERKDIVSEVKRLCDIEFKGSKELDIRANGDPRYMTKLIISLPNELTADKAMENLKELLEKKGIKEYPHIIAIHRGEKDGIKNLHAHVNFFERKFEPGNSKKNRLFNKRDFVQTLKDAYQKQFGLTANSEEDTRQRIAEKNLPEFKAMQNELATIRKEIDLERKIEANRADIAERQRKAALTEKKPVNQPVMLPDEEKKENDRRRKARAIFEYLNVHHTAKRLTENEKIELLQGKTVDFRLEINCVIQLKIKEGVTKEGRSGFYVATDTHDFYKNTLAWKNYQADPEGFFKDQEQQQSRGYKR